MTLMPVIVPFFQEHGLSMKQIYHLISIFAFGVVILEAPSGYISDLLGRKKTLVVSGIFQGLAFTILAVSSNYWMFVIFELFNAISVSLYSGTDVALIYDTIYAIDKKEPENKILGRRIFYSQIGETVAALAGGMLASISLMLPAKLNAVTGWLPMLVALTLYEPQRNKLNAVKHWQNAKYIYRKLFVESKLLRLIFLNYMSLGLAGYIVVWAFQGYWKDIGIPLRYFGYLWAAYNLTVALSGRIAHHIEKRLGSAAALLLMSLLPIIGFTGMAFFSSMVGVLFGLSFKVARGMNQVILRDALNTRVRGEMRATANSIASLGVRLAFVGFGPLMGFLIDGEGYRVTFIVFAGIYFLSFIILCLPLIARKSEFKPLHSEA